MDANLVLLSKKGKQRIIPLPSNVTIIGRRHNCDLRIPLDSISKRHCQIIQEDAGTLRLKDLGSRNGTFLNGKRIEEEAVKAGDQIKIGPILFAIQIDGQPETIAAPSEKKDQEQDLSEDTVTQEELDDSLIDLEASGDLGALNDMDAALDNLDDLDDL
jgi:pSer/pThr/pTyr-binding forkhead associated (FHA) protein